MAELGKYNNLEVVKILDFGVYLDGGVLGEILMPRRYVPENTEIGDVLEVFLYLDSEDRPIATNDQPYASVGEFALLKVKEVNRVGAFLDWGLMKDLLVPFREQPFNLEVGMDVFVYVFLDTDSGRIVGSCRLDRYLDNVPPTYEEGQEVDLLVCNQTDIGFNAIVNNLHWGMIYKNEVFKPLQRGDRLKGYVKKVREDEKIDLSIEKPGFKKIDDTAQLLITKLVENNGFLALTDKSAPEVVYEVLGLSKKSFKMTVGVLFKQRLIVIESNGIRLLDKKG